MKTYVQPKKWILLFIVALTVFSASQAQDSKQDKKAKQEAQIKQIVDSQHYVFKAQTAYPLGARSVQLTSDYDLKITKDEIVSYLPYYGRAYSATPGSSDNGLNFTTKSFEYSSTPTKKDDGWEIVIKPKDTKQAREMLLTAFKNGSANLTVNSNDKQTISFSGYIVPIKPKKK
jgi:hypothetical protein